MAINKDEISRLLIALNHAGYNSVPSIIRRIDESMQWAWDNWSNLEKFYNNEKPSIPTEDFIKEWVDNEDFEADGYDIEALAEL